MSENFERVNLGGAFLVATSAFLFSPANNAEASEIDQCRYYQSGEASYYGRGFSGRPMANGVRFNPNNVTVAHRNIRLGERVVIVNQRNGQMIDTEVTDRGPYALSTRFTVQGRSQPRVVDVSEAGAQRLGFIQQGVTAVSIYICPQPLPVPPIPPDMTEIAEAPDGSTPGAALAGMRLDLSAP